LRRDEDDVVRRALDFKINGRQGRGRLRKNGESRWKKKLRKLV